jgi:hypothetical protein
MCRAAHDAAVAAAQGTAAEKAAEQAVAGAEQAKAEEDVAEEAMGGHCPGTIISRFECAKWDSNFRWNSGLTAPIRRRCQLWDTFLNRHTCLQNNPILSKVNSKPRVPNFSTVPGLSNHA